MYNSIAKQKYISPKMLITVVHRQVQHKSAETLLAQERLPSHLIITLVLIPQCPALQVYVA